MKFKSTSSIDTGAETASIPFNRHGETPMNAPNPTPTQAYPVRMLPSHKAEELTKGGNLAQIELGDQLYTLRITRAGKLILTK